MAPNMPGSWMPDDFERMWADLAPVGRSASSGGYFRQPFLSAERELATWFEEQCAARGLDLETDGVGNVVAWWGARGPGAVVTGSHLDSVLDGGAYDGPLGVVSALAAVDVLRSRGFAPARPLGVSVFVEEEGRGSGWRAWARGWPVARCRGSARGSCATATGCSWPTVSRLRVSRARPAPRCWTVSATFVELHVEQGRDLVDRSARSRGRERDLAARALPLRVPRCCRPCGHDADGGPRATRC